MMVWVGSPSRLAKYEPPRKRPVSDEGTLVSVAHCLRRLRMERYSLHGMGSLVGAAVEADADEVEASADASVDDDDEAKRKPCAAAGVTRMARCARRPRDWVRRADMI